MIYDVHLWVLWSNWIGINWPRTFYLWDEKNGQFFILDWIKTTIQFFLFTDDHISFSIAFDVYLLHYTPVTTPNLSNNISGILIKSVVCPSLFNMVFNLNTSAFQADKPMGRADFLARLFALALRLISLLLT